MAKELTEQEKQVEAWKEQYSGLVKACRGGVKRDTPIAKKVFEMCTSELEFVRACLLNTYPVQFMKKLFSLDLDGISIQVPASSSEEDAKMCLDAYLNSVKAKVAAIPVEELESMARDATLVFGTHFNSKLVHSSAGEISLLCTPTDKLSAQPAKVLPYLYSRRFANPLMDQTRNDTRGVFQQLSKVWNEENTILDLSTVEVLRRGVESAVAAQMETAGSIRNVDPRMRQLLVPFGDDHMSISPIPFPTTSVALHKARERMKESFLARLLEEAVPEESSMEEKGKKKAKKAKKTKVEPPKAPSFFELYPYPVGGANPQNVTLLPAFFMTMPFAFEGPVRDVQKRFDLALAKKGVQIHLDATRARKIADSVRKISEASLGKQKLVELQTHANGVLASWVREQHSRLMNLKHQISDNFDFSNLDPLTAEVVQGQFGSKYTNLLVERMLKEIQKACEKHCTDFTQSLKSHVEASIRRILEV